MNPLVLTGLILGKEEVSTRDTGWKPAIISTSLFTLLNHAHRQKLDRKIVPFDLMDNQEKGRRRLTSIVILTISQSWKEVERDSFLSQGLKASVFQWSVASLFFQSVSTVSVLGLGSPRLLEKVAYFDIDQKSESTKSWAHLIIEVLTWRRRLIYQNIKAKGCGQEANRIGSIAAQKGYSQGIIPALERFSVQGRIERVLAP